MSRISVILIAIAWLLSTTSQPAVAARQLPVAVQVRIYSGVVQNDWTDDETADIAAALRATLQEMLSEAFRHWLFRQPDGGRPALRLELRPGLGDSSTMTLVGVGNVRTQDLTEAPPWLAPGERSSEGFPPPKTAKAELKRHLTSGVLGDRNNVNRVGSWLRNTVPIAPEGHWMENDTANKPLIALSLPVSEFGALRMSVFHVAAKAPDGHAEMVEAAGMDVSVPYPPGAQPPEFRGLAARAERRIVGTTPLNIDSTERPQLEQFRLGPVFLFEEREPTLFQSDDWVDR